MRVKKKKRMSMRYIGKEKRQRARSLRRFRIVIEKANGNYSAYSPDFTGCIATGRTKKQTAIEMIEAIELHIKGLNLAAASRSGAPCSSC
jgi:predicted RNase H-like HicB family nuclease